MKSSYRKKSIFIALSVTLLLVAMTLTGILAPNVKVGKAKADGVVCYDSTNPVGTCDGKDPQQCVVASDGTIIGSTVGTYYMQNSSGTVAELMLWFSERCHTNWGQVYVFQKGYQQQNATLSLNLRRQNSVDEKYATYEPNQPTNTNPQVPGHPEVQEESHTNMLYVPDQPYDPAQICATVMVPIDSAGHVDRADNCITQDQYGNPKVTTYDEGF